MVYNRRGSAEAREDLLAVLAQYDVGELGTCWPVEHGYVNQTWVIEATTGRYVLKRRHPSLRRPCLIGAQHALIQHLGAVGFPAPTIVRTRHGTTFLQIGDEMYEMHRYISGDLCDVTRPAHFAAAAFTLGWYHSAVRGFDHPALHRAQERYGAVALERIVDRLMADWCGKLSPPLRRMCEQLERQVRDLRTRFRGFAGAERSGDLPKLVIHGDFYAENLILQGDVVAGVVDYDQAHWCWRAMEVAEALIYFAREPGRRLKHIVYSGVLDLSAVERFLAAYAGTVSLSESEVRALPHLIRTIWLCASLDPPLRGLLSLEGAPQALPEVLTLVDWAQAHASEIVEIGLDVRGRGVARPAS